MVITLQLAIDNRLTHLPLLLSLCRYSFSVAHEGIKQIVYVSLHTMRLE
jgi:hypothetical protein